MDPIPQSGSPRVSIILPTYRTSVPRLAASIDSALAQTMTSWELIVVDDGSEHPYAGLDTMSPYRQDARIVWQPMTSNVGVAAARNAGMQRSRGGCIAFLDCGDVWHAEKLERQLGKLESLPEDYGLVTCGVRYAGDGKSYVRIPRHRGDLLRQLLVRVVIPGSPSSVLMRRDVLDRVGLFYAARDLPEDRDYWIRACKEFKLDYVPEVLVDIEIDPGGRGADPARKAITYRRLLERYAMDIEEAGVEQQAWAHYYLFLAKKHLRRQEWLGAARSIGTALLRTPAGVVALSGVPLRNWLSSAAYRLRNS